MEQKKVYKIRRWFCNSPHPERVLLELPRRDSEDEDYAFEKFRGIANAYLRSGYVISHINHHWNYVFTTRNGSKFRFYMYED